MNKLDAVIVFVCAQTFPKTIFSDALCLLYSIVVACLLRPALLVENSAKTGPATLCIRNGVSVLCRKERRDYLLETTTPVTRRQAATSARHIKVEK